MDTAPSQSPLISPVSERARLTRHVPALDGVRGLAILLVMAHNFNLLEAPESRGAKLVDLALNFGWVGVQLFFVLSGFLITNILLSTRDSRNYFRSFFGRRAVRIFPLYYISLAVGLLVVPALTGSALEGSEHQVWLWTYLSNWAAPAGEGVSLYPHMWSLAVEEQFYLVWPVAVYFLSRRGLLRFCLALTALALFTRIGIRAFGLSTEAAYQFTICRIDAIALGAVAAIGLRNRRIVNAVQYWSPQLRKGLVCATLLTILVTRGAPRVGVLTQTFGYTLFALIAALFVFDIALSNGRRGDWLTKLLSWPVLRKIGTYSYGAYVIHKPLHQLVGLPLVRALTGGGSVSAPGALLYFLVMGGAVFFLAFLSFHAIEKHFLSLKRHFAASR